MPAGVATLELRCQSSMASFTAYIEFSEVECTGTQEVCEL
jgi:hypothetical protein